MDGGGWRSDRVAAILDQLALAAQKSYPCKPILHLLFSSHLSRSNLTLNVLTKRPYTATFSRLHQDWDQLREQHRTLARILADSDSRPALAREDRSRGFLLRFDCASQRAVSEPKSSRRKEGSLLLSNETRGKLERLCANPRSPGQRQVDCRKVLKAW